MKTITSVRSAAALAVVLAAFLAVAVPAQKLSADEIVAKHLDAVGSAETRKKLKNHVATGAVRFSVLRQAGLGGDGKIVFASEGPKSLLGMTFAMPNYRSDTIVYDGKKMKINFAYINRRSDLGDYIFRYDDVVKEGLFGGTLSTAWPLYDLSVRKPRLEADGTKKVNDREAYVLSYLPKGGSDLEIKIYLDKENFQHVRTEYRRIISAGQGSSPDASSQRRELRQNLTEEFSDFKKKNDLTIPHKYRAYLMIEGDAGGTREYEWKAELTDFYANQPLDPGSFSTEGN